LNPRAVLAVVVLCLVSAAAGFGAYRWWHAAPGEPEFRPDLQFTGVDGATHRLSDWDGKLLLLNFWATWCPPCLKEIPLLVKTQHEHAANGLQIVGLALDHPEMVPPFRERFGINYPLMIGELDVARAMDALGDRLGALPFSVLITPDGRIAERIYGDISEDEMRELLAKYLQP
jgi:thiol-disulfide isomerase/thioredoxin